MVMIEYRAREGSQTQLLAALRAARFSRRRTGASRWRVWQDWETPSRFLEQFVVASWQQHQRQGQRITARDQQRLEAIHALTDHNYPTQVTHWLTPDTRGDISPPP
jgi:hypothetical protein